MSSRDEVLASIRANRPQVERPLPPVSLFDTTPPASLLAAFKESLTRMGGLFLGFLIGLLYLPSGATEPKRSSNASRGTWTLSNQIRPLSTPLRPPLCPSSSIRTPKQTRPRSSRIGTNSTCTP